jgi:hypothetical protein
MLGDMGHVAYWYTIVLVMAVEFGLPLAGIIVVGLWIARRVRKSRGHVTL